LNWLAQKIELARAKNGEAKYRYKRQCSAVNSKQSKFLGLVRIGLRKEKRGNGAKGNAAQCNQSKKSLWFGVVSEIRYLAVQL
jgi:hypothetical protein